MKHEKQNPKKAVFVHGGEKYYFIFNVIKVLKYLSLDIKNPVSKVGQLINFYFGLQNSVNDEYPFGAGSALVRMGVNMQHPP